jgi:hypothetical protein
MSVSFEKQTKEALKTAGDAIAGDPQNIPGTSGKHPITAAIGTALTGGKEMAGTKGYLAVRNHHFPLPRHQGSPMHVVFYRPT